MLDISDIQMISVIAEEGSINRACEILHISQPTLSKRLSRLEQKLKIELFHRHTNGMVPSAAAKYLMKAGVGLQDQMHVIERQLELMANLVGGEVNLGVGPTVVQLLLSKALLDFVDKQHKFKVSVVTESPDRLLELLRTGQIEVAVGPFNLENLSDEYKVVMGYSEPVVIAVRSDHELTKQGGKVDLQTIFNYPSISPHIPLQFSKRAQQLFNLSSFSPNITCDNYAIAKTIVSNSDYVTAGPESIFHQEFESQSLVKLEIPVEVMWQCYCIAKPETLLMPAVKEVVDIFAQYMDVQ